MRTFKLTFEGTTEWPFSITEKEIHARNDHEATKKAAKIANNHGWILGRVEEKFDHKKK